MTHNPKALIKQYFLTSLPAAIMILSNSTAYAQATQDSSNSAEVQDPDAESRVTDEEIIVSAERIRGSAITNIPPIVELEPDDIKSFGVGSIEELLNELSPQTNSGRGRSNGGRIILVNGKRISSFREIFRYPPEAIRKVEIFPEDVALQYGYRPTQKVINIILAESYTGLSGKLGFGQPTRGHFSSKTAVGTLTKISKSSRLNLDVTYKNSTILTEAERGIVQDNNTLPFALGGNIGASPYQQNAEIDPALSALTGTKTTLIGVPQKSQPMLTDFAEPSNQARATNVGEFRSLLPASDDIKVNASYSRKIFNSIELTLTGSFQTKESRSLLGLSAVQLNIPATNPFSPFSQDASLFRYFNPATPLSRSSNTHQTHLAARLSGRESGWYWNLDTSYSRTLSRVQTDRTPDVTALQQGINQSDPMIATNPFSNRLQLGPLRTSFSRNLNQVITSKFNALGSPVELPAGPVMAAIQASISHNESNSLNEFSGPARTAALSRDQISTGLNINIPLANKNADVLPELGSLYLDGNFEYHKISNFGGLVQTGFGLTWAPIKSLTFSMSATVDSQAPSVQQLAGATINTPNVTVFDFVRQENVLVNIITGNNPNLRTEQRRDVNLAISYRPTFLKGSRFELGFTQNRNRDNVAGFPLLTPEIERAFPDRITRDPFGQLVSIDQRPVNFNAITKRQIKWGLHFFKRLTSPVKKTEPGSAPSPSKMLPFGRKPGQSGRWGLSATHTIVLANEVDIRPGLPKLDLLNGSATGSGGGTARHQIKINGRWFKNGYGARLSADFKSATRIQNNPQGGSPASELRFSELLTVNLRMFVNFEQQSKLIESLPFLKRSRLSLRVDNVFDTVQHVRDSNGVTPLSYQAGRLNARGRFVSINFRKQF